MNLNRLKRGLERGLFLFVVIILAGTVFIGNVAYSRAVSSYTTTVAVAEEATIYIGPVSIRRAETFSLWLKGMSASGTSNFAVSYLHSFNRELVIVDCAEETIVATINDDLCHLNIIQPILIKYLVIKIVGQSGNPSDTIVMVKLNSY